MAIIINKSIPILKGFKMWSTSGSDEIMHILDLWYVSMYKWFRTNINWRDKLCHLSMYGWNVGEIFLPAPPSEGFGTFCTWAQISSHRRIHPYQNPNIQCLILRSNPDIRSHLTISVFESKSKKKISYWYWYMHISIHIFWSVSIAMREALTLTGSPRSKHRSAPSSSLEDFFLNCAWRLI